MVEAAPGSSLPAEPDDFVLMMRRRSINQRLATQPVDFYPVGFEKALLYAGLTAEDADLDIGCSNGELYMRAAQAAGALSYHIGLDPNREPYDRYWPPDLSRNRFSFMQGRGETIPLPDNAVRVAFAHNSIFRGTPERILQEMKRVTEPGGLLIISTNGIKHALWRHTFERRVALSIARWQGEQRIRPYIRWPKPPAHSFYLEDAPAKIRAAGGLDIIEVVSQQCEGRVTPADLEEFITSIKETVNRTGLAEQYHERWFETVDQLARPIMERLLEKRRRRAKETDAAQEPYFTEKIVRGMFVIRNNKEKWTVRREHTEIV